MVAVSQTARPPSKKYHRHHSAILEFKCVKISSGDMATWEPICLNRKHVVESEEVVRFEYGISEMKVSLGHGLYRHDSSSFIEEGHEIGRLAEFGIVMYENSALHKHMFSLSEQGMKHRLTEQGSVEEFVKSELHEAKGIWYVSDREILQELNAYHNHSLNICFDNRQEKILEIK